MSSWLHIRLLGVWVSMVTNKSLPQSLSGLQEKKPGKNPSVCVCRKWDKLSKVAPKSFFSFSEELSLFSSYISPLNPFNVILALMKTHYLSQATELVASHDALWPFIFSSSSCHLSKLQNVIIFCRFTYLGDCAGEDMIFEWDMLSLWKNGNDKRCWPRLESCLSGFCWCRQSLLTLLTISLLPALPLGLHIGPY